MLALKAHTDNLHNAPHLRISCMRQSHVIRALPCSQQLAKCAWPYMLHTGSCPAFYQSKQNCWTANKPT